MKCEKHGDTGQSFLIWGEKPVMRTCSIIFGFAVLAASARGDEPVILKGFDGWVGAIAFTPDGRKLAVGTSDGVVSLWDGKETRKVFAVPELKVAISALAFSPGGTTLL